MLVPKLRFKEFKDEWKTYNLKQILEIKNGLNKEKESFGTGTPIINYMDVNKNEILTANKIKGLVKLSKKEIDNFKVNKGDIFFTRTSETSDEIGLSASLIEDIEDCVFSGFILKATPIKNIFNNLFSGYYFRTDKLRKEIIKHSSITTRALTSGSLLYGMNINIPNIDEQSKIGTTLYLLDKKIELQKQKIEALKIYKMGLFNKIYKEKMKEIKEEEIKKYVSLQGGYAFKSELFSKKGIPIIRIANMNKNIVDLKDIVFYDKEIPIDSKFEVNTGDILIAMSGATTGKIGIYKETIKAYLNQRVGKVVLKRKDIIYSYLYFLFELSSYNMQLNTKLAAGAQPNISPSDIETLKFKVPSMEMQKHISNIAININKKLEMEGNKLQELNELKKGLLQKMFI